MGKLKEMIKKSNRTRWQNVSKVHQVVYDQKGLAVNVCVGAIIAPQTDDAENWWREKLKQSPFFEPVVLTPQSGPSVLKPALSIGFPGFGTERKDGTVVGSNVGLKTPTVAQVESSTKSFPVDIKPTEGKGGMGLRTEIDGMIKMPGEDESVSTIVERPKPANMNIPDGVEELVTTGRTGKTRRGRPKSNPSAIDTPVIGQGSINNSDGGDTNG